MVAAILEGLSCAYLSRVYNKMPMTHPSAAPVIEAGQAKTNHLLPRARREVVVFMLLNRDSGMTWVSEWAAFAWLRAIGSGSRSLLLR